MHELALCQGLLHQVEAVARDHAAEAVSRVTVRIGPLSGVEPALLQQAYVLAQADSIAAGARLVVERLPIRVRCSQCGAESEVEPNALVCARCGDWRTELMSGDEMVLASVELVTSERSVDA
jgi:hydrogenase nickel incorporation protein HypA/HybF